MTKSKIVMKCLRIDLYYIVAVNYFTIACFFIIRFEFSVLAS